MLKNTGIGMQTDRFANLASIEKPLDFGLSRRWPGAVGHADQTVHKPPKRR